MTRSDLFRITSIQGFESAKKKKKPENVTEIRELPGFASPDTTVNILLLL